MLSKLVKNEESNVAQFLQKEKESRYIREQELLRLQQQIACAQVLPPSKINWQQVKQQALARYQDEPCCAICYNALFEKNKPLALLSCAHIYHWNCLLGFERYTEGSKCPMCRQGYEKVLMADGGQQEKKPLQQKNQINEFRINTKKNSKKLQSQSKFSWKGKLNKK